MNCNLEIYDYNFEFICSQTLIGYDFPKISIRSKIA